VCSRSLSATCRRRGTTPVSPSFTVIVPCCVYRVRKTHHVLWSFSLTDKMLVSLFTLGINYAPLVIRSQVDSSKYRCKCTQNVEVRQQMYSSVNINLNPRCLNIPKC
jgi:hypothetical protein